MSFPPPTKAQQEVIDICIKQLNLMKGMFVVNADLSIDTLDTLVLDDLKLTELPVKINSVTKGINAVNSKLTSWKNFPDIVDGDLVMRSSNIETLEGMPREVRGYFSMRFTPISSLKGIAKRIGKSNAAIYFGMNCKNGNFMDASEYMYGLFCETNNFDTGFSEIDRILSFDRVDGKMPRELIPSKINELRDIDLVKLRGRIL
jgi:hypothetical protein